MKINLKIILIVSFFTNFLFAENLDQINEENIEIVEKSNFQKLEEIEDYIQNSKFKRFFLDPISLYSNIMNGYARGTSFIKMLPKLNLDYFKDADRVGKLTANFLVMLNDFFNIDIFAKRIYGIKNLEITNNKIFNAAGILYNILQLKYTFAYLKYFKFLNKDINSALFITCQLNNISELYLRGMNLTRAFKK